MKTIWSPLDTPAIRILLWSLQVNHVNHGLVCWASWPERLSCFGIVHVTSARIEFRLMLDANMNHLKMRPRRIFFWPSQNKTKLFIIRCPFLSHLCDYLIETNTETGSQHAKEIIWPGTKTPKRTQSFRVMGIYYENNTII